MERLWDTVDIIENTGFDAYNNPNAPFIEAQQVLHQRYPEIYPEKPNWDFSQLEEVMIGGMNDDFKFYKYK